MRVILKRDAVEVDMDACPIELACLLYLFDKGLVRGHLRVTYDGAVRSLDYEDIDREKTLFGVILPSAEQQLKLAI